MSDAVLVLLPSPRPAAFAALGLMEQAWRGRLFIMVWTRYRDEAYSWWAALLSEPDWEAGMRHLVSQTSDAFLVEAFAAAWDEQGRW